MDLALQIYLMKFLTIFIMDRERAGHGFVYGLGCVFTSMDWMTRQIAYDTIPPFPWFSS